MYAHGEACRPDEGRIDIGAGCPVLSMVRESYGCIIKIRVSWSGSPGSCLGPDAPTRSSMTLLYASQSPLALDQLAGQERWAGDCSACRCGVVPDLAPPLPEGLGLASLSRSYIWGRSPPPGCTRTPGLWCGSSALRASRPAIWSQAGFPLVAVQRQLLLPGEPD